MTTVFSNSVVDDNTRRELLYQGQVFVYSATPASALLAAFARELIAEAFGERDPETAQFDMPVEEFAELLAGLKPRFIHHPRCKELLPAVLKELGCDLDRTYFDVPRLRTSTSTTTSPPASPTPSTPIATAGTRPRSTSSTGGSPSTRWSRRT